VGADHRADGVGKKHQRGDVEARLVRDLAVDFALAFDHHDGLEARPLVARLQPADIVDHRVVSRLDTAVVGVECFMRADRRILEFQGFLFIDEDLDILAQGSAMRTRIPSRGGEAHSQSRSALGARRSRRLALKRR
jgi:hypothetical protein